MIDSCDSPWSYWYRSFNFLKFLGNLDCILLIEDHTLKTLTIEHAFLFRPKVSSLWFISAIKNAYFVHLRGKHILHLVQKSRMEMVKCVPSNSVSFLVLHNEDSLVRLTHCPSRSLPKWFREGLYRHQPSSCRHVAHLVWAGHFFSAHRMRIFTVFHWSRRNKHST